MNITAAPLSSHQLAGYSFTETIYQGTRTTVYRAIETATQQSVVIKVLSQEYPSFAELVQFRNQYTVAKNLPIAGIIRPHRLEPCGNGYALVMEDIAGIDLGQYAQQYSLDLVEILSIATQLAEILHELHQHRVIHKDIKPANILIHPDSKQLKLIDFSIASLLPKETQAIQSPQSLEGTLAYLAPEQTGRMNRAIDYRTDFYALGVTLYELLTGQLPFASDDPLELIHCHMAQLPTDIEQIRPDIPAMVVAIVSKLMAKNAEDRYQSALGLKHDLKHCLIQWKEQGKIDEFKLGQRDLCDRFLIPEKLYGRDGEVQTLLDAFDQVAKGASKLMLVAGFSGIGKTAVINEVYKPIVRQRGYFIKGKFDQFNRNIPLSAFVQAFRNLMGQLLSESDEALACWSKRILNVVGDSGQVLIEVIPELEHIIGTQPAATELSGAAAQNRFNVLFQKFIAVFTTPEHPLVIFLDDLQWADSASLNLMQVLMGESETTYMLLLGAYRDNEVFPAHPLMLTLEKLENQATAISTITLTPLSSLHIHQLVVETLSYPSDMVQPLTDLIYHKTQGNPFFTTQLLKGLYDDNLIVFNAAQGRWDYDFGQIQGAILTDDVVVFMTSRLQQLPQNTQNAMALAACIGNQFELETLAIVCKSPVEVVATELWPALQEGLIIPITEAYKFFQDRAQNEVYSEDIVVGYRFLHDRVQQATYSLIPDGYQKQSTHLQIGQLLLAHQSPSEREDNIFNILNHLMMGIEADPESIPVTELADLSLRAGIKAKLSVAYQSAIDYFEFGLSRLLETAWDVHYRVTLDLNREYGECEYFLGQFEASETRLNTTLKHVKAPLDAAQIYEILTNQRITRGIDIQSSIDAALEGLAMLGINIPTHSEALESLTNQELQKVQRVFEQMSPDALLDLPPISDLIQRNCMKLLGSLWTASYIVGKTTLNFLTTLRTINLSLEYGQAEGSSLAYTCYGMVLAFQGDYEQAYQFGKVALSVDRTLQNTKFMGKNNNLFAHSISPYVRPLKENLFLYQESVAICSEVGDLVYGVWAILFIIWTQILQGKVLSEIEEQSQQYLDYVHRCNDQNILYVFQLQQKFIHSLVKGDSSEHLLTYQGFMDNPSLEQWLQNKFEHGINWYGFLVLYRLYLQGNYIHALQVSQHIESTLPTNFGFFPIILYHLYYPLSLLAVYPEVDKHTQNSYWNIIQEQQQILETWSQTCPSTFQHKYDLVSAEMARLNDNPLEAMERYDRAIAGANANHYIQEEALANELAAKFYLNWGKEKVAAGYMQEAYYCYSRWGAKAKVIDLETRYPDLLRVILQSSATSEYMLTTLMTIAAPTASANTGTHNSSSNNDFNQTFDFASILKASQVLSSVIKLDELLRQLTQIILQNSGGDYCALVLPTEQGDWQVQAIASPEETRLQTEPLANNPNLPVKLIQYVKNTQEIIVIDDLVTDLPVVDDYLRAQQPKSVLCLPILNQGSLIGILYLKNNLTSGVFTKERILVLNFLCAQAAISLENARLYQQSQHYAEQLEQSQLQLVQNEKMATLGNLVAGVAHEVNNPIGFLNGSIQNVKDYLQDLFEHLECYQKYHPPTGPVQENAEDIDLEFVLADLPKLLDSMKGATNRIKGISTSLRTFSRADTENKVSANLHEGLDSTLLILKYRLKANEQRPAIDVMKNYGELPEITCFPGQLNQVFMNILANAIDMFDEMAQSMPLKDLKNHPQQITIATAHLADQDAIEVRISDNGWGMPDEVKSRIFDHSFTTKAVGKGTGLGLAIARQIIVDTHGGSLDVQSEVGQGSEFCIRLPL